MAYNKNSVVSVAKCFDPHNFETVKTCVRKSIESIGGLESLVMQGDTVMLKPNVVMNANYMTGTTTNPYVTFAAADLCHEAGAKKVIIAEGSGIGSSTTQCYKSLGYIELAQKHNCELVDLLKDEFEYVLNPIAKTMKRLRLPRTFLESDMIINIPVMKTHDCLNVTLGLKNLKGLLHYDDKKRFHKWGLVQAILDLCTLAMPELTIADGTVGMEGLGPCNGTPVNLGLILASKDTCALDRVCLDIMGFSLSEVEYIEMAGKMGLGEIDLSYINITGEKLEDVRRPFVRAGSIENKKAEKYNISLLPCDACSGCQTVASTFLLHLDNKGLLPKLKDHVIVYGQTPKVPQNENRKIFLFGTCTKKMNNDMTNKDCFYVPGCPPHLDHIYEAFDRIEIEEE